MNSPTFIFTDSLENRPFFLQLQEFNSQILTVNTSTSVTRRSPHNLKFIMINILDKTADLRITFNLDGTPITFKSHTHPSQSQTSRLLTSSVCLGVPTPKDKDEVNRREVQPKRG